MHAVRRRSSPPSHAPRYVLLPLAAFLALPSHVSLSPLYFSLFLFTGFPLSLFRFPRQRICSPIGWLLLMSAGSLSTLSPLIQATLNLSLSPSLPIFPRWRDSSLRLPGNRDFPYPAPTPNVNRDPPPHESEPDVTTFSLCVPRVSEIPSRASENARLSMVYRGAFPV